MKKELSKTEARKKIEDYFKQDNLNNSQTRKIKRLSMKYKIRLGDYRRRFCKKCLLDLKDGKIRIDKFYKIAECKCGFKNRFKIS